MTEPAEQPRKPKLEVCLEQGEIAIATLREVSDKYQQVKSLLTAPDALSDMQLMLKVGELNIPVTLPADPAARQSVLEEAAAALGEEVIRLWGQLHSTTTEAVEHCAAAAARV